MATAEFSKFAGILSAARSQHHLSGCEIAELEFHHTKRLFSLTGYCKISSVGSCAIEEVLVGYLFYT